MRLDRHGRAVKLDTWGMEYVRDEGFAFYITPCCDASAKGVEYGTACRACFTEIDAVYGGVPEPFDEDMTEDEKRKLAEWKEFEQRMVRKSLGKE